MPQSHPAPFLTAVGALESEEFKRQTALIASHWKDAHRGDVPLEGYNHLTICDALGDPSHALFQSTCELLESV